MQPTWSLIEPVAIATGLALSWACLAPVRRPPEPSRDPHETEELSTGWTRRGMSMNVRSRPVGGR